MAESVKGLEAAGMLNGDELGAVLTSLGGQGDEHDRLAAVVALLTNHRNEPGKMVRGAFAGVGSMIPEAKVRSAFTSALHSCLREQPVNAGSPATNSSV